MMPQEQPMPEMKEQAPEAAPEGAQAGDQLLLVNDALTGLAGAFAEDKKTPPEAVSALKEASAAYQKFLSILGESKGIPTPEVKGPGGIQPVNSAGAKGAVPADMPVQANAKPAY